MPQSLAKSDYQILLNSISEIYTRSSQQAELALNHLRISAYWEIGKRIVRVEQDNHLRAAYGAKLIGNLSADLTSKFGNGFSVRNLQYMRRFYVAYPQISQTSAQLPWSTFQVLSTIKDKKKREELTQKAAKNSWSVRDLKAAIKEDNVELEELERPLLEALLSPVKLKASLGQLYTYKLKFEPATLILSEVERLALGDTDGLMMLPGDESRSGKYLVDLGFSVSKDAGTRGLKSVKDDMIVESAAVKNGYSLKESDAKPGSLYTYKAYLERVVDGDTILCLIDLGFEVWISQKLRLRFINCPELSTQKGQEVKAFVETELKGKSLLIKTYKPDKYDRYLVDVWVSPANDEQRPTSNGLYLNQALLDKGLAEMYVE